MQAISSFIDWGTRKESLADYFLSLEERIFPLTKVKSITPVPLKGKTGVAHIRDCAHRVDVGNQILESAFRLGSFRLEI